MSHFSVLVIGDDVENQLAPFDGDITLEPYVIGIVGEEEKQRMLSYYKEKEGLTYSSFDECYAEKGKEWNYNHFKKNENGVWEEWSTYNPDSQWDYWRIGGRWSGTFELREGAESKPLTSLPWEYDRVKDEEKKILLNGKHANQAAKKDVANIDEVIPFAVLKYGEWHERGQMGWWGMTANEKEQHIWEDEVKQLLSDVPEDELLTIVDCHI